MMTEQNSNGGNGAGIALMVLGVVFVLCVCGALVIAVAGLANNRPEQLEPTKIYIIDRDGKTHEHPAYIRPDGGLYVPDKYPNYPHRPGSLDTGSKGEKK